MDSDRPEAISLLLEYWTSIERRYSEGLTPLAFAARWDYVKAAEVLVSQGASVNSVMHGSTALAIAIDYDSVPMVKFLLENAADLNITNIRTSETRTLLLRAIKKPDSEEVGQEIVRLLLIHGADPNCYDWKGRTRLFFATVKQNLDIMRLLLGHGADPTRENGGIDLISWAFLKGHEEVVQILLKCD